MTDPEPRWLWQDDSSAWRAYEKDNSDLLEAIWITDGDTAEIEEESEYIVDLKKREHKDKKTNKVRPVLRSTWFWKDEKGRYQPHDEIIAQRLEDAFEKRIVGVKVPIDAQRHVILALDGSGVQHFNGADHTSRGKVVRRGFEGRTVRREPGALPPKKIPVPEIVHESAKKSDSASGQLVGAVKKANNSVPPKNSKGSPSAVPRGNAPSGKSSPNSDPAPQLESSQPNKQKPLVDASTSGVWKEGLVAKAADKKLKSWDTRWLSLLPDALVVHKEDQSKEVERINLAHIVSSSVDKSAPRQFGTVFLLNRLDGQTVAFRAGDDVDAASWVEAINSSLNHGTEAKSTKTAIAPVAAPQPHTEKPPAFVEPSPSFGGVPSLVDPQDDTQRLYNPFAGYPAFVPPYSMYAALEGPTSQPSAFASMPPGFPGGVGSSGFNSAFYPAPPAAQSPLFGPSLFDPVQAVPQQYPPSSGLWGPDPFSSMMQMQQHLPQYTPSSLHQNNLHNPAPPPGAYAPGKPL